MKKHIIGILLISSFNLMAANVCNINVKDYNLNASVDCVNCQPSLYTPVNDLAPKSKWFDSVVSKLNGEEEQFEIKKLKVLDHFLSGKANAQNCSNFESIKNDFKIVFKNQLKQCESNVGLVSKIASSIDDKPSKLCAYVLEKYNSTVINSFFAYWNEQLSDGSFRQRTGTSLEQLEEPIRAQARWCNNVQKKYKNVFIYCTELNDWVAQFDKRNEVSEMMRKMREDDNRSKDESPEDSRNKMFQNGCKYFETHSATTLTQDLYLECAVRGF